MVYVVYFRLTFYTIQIRYQYINTIVYKRSVCLLKSYRGSVYTRFGTWRKPIEVRPISAMKRQNRKKNSKTKKRRGSPLTYRSIMRAERQARSHAPKLFDKKHRIILEYTSTAVLSTFCRTRTPKKEERKKDF